MKLSKLFKKRTNPDDPNYPILFLLIGGTFIGGVYLASRETDPRKSVKSK